MTEIYNNFVFVFDMIPNCNCAYMRAWVSDLTDWRTASMRWMAVEHRFVCCYSRFISFHPTEYTLTHSYGHNRLVLFIYNRIDHSYVRTEYESDANIVRPSIVFQYFNDYFLFNNLLATTTKIYVKKNSLNNDPMNRRIERTKKQRMCVHERQYNSAHNKNCNV